MNFEEKASLVLFVIATVLSFTRQFYQDMLPGLKPAYVFIICAIVCFLITNRDGERLMIWKSVQTKIVWELIYIFAGGLAAVACIYAGELFGYGATIKEQDGFVAMIVGLLSGSLTSTPAFSAAKATVDEAFTGLDEQNVKSAVEQILKISQNKAIILISHSALEAELLNTKQKKL